MFEILNIIFFLLCILALVSNYFSKKTKNFFVGIIFIVLFSVAIFREIGFDQDSLMYYYMFRNDEIKTEISFQLITKVIKNILHGDFFYILVFYAFIAMFIKFYFINKTTDFIIFSTLLYFSYFFLLQEMTQIRAGVASAFLMLVVKNIIDKKINYAIFFFLLAILFHTSSIAFFPIFFLATKSLNKKMYIVLIIGSYLIYPYINNFTEILSIYINNDRIIAKANSYGLDNGKRLNIFNAWQIIRIVFSLLFVFFSKKLQLKNEYSILLIKLYLISTCVFVLLSDNPVFAGRISDLYAATDIVLIPFLLYLIPQKFRILYKMVIILVAFSYFYLNMYYIKIFN